MLLSSIAYPNSWFFSGSATCDLSTVTGIRVIYQAKDLALSNGAPVTSWPSTGPVSYTFSEGSTPPSFVTNVINSKPVVRFDGVNDLLTGPSASSNVFTTAYTWIFVARPIAISGDNVANPTNADAFYNDVILADSFIGNAFVMKKTGPQAQMAVYSGSGQSYAVATTPAVGSPFIGVSRFSGTQISTQVNGGARVDTSFSATVQGQLTALIMAKNINNPSVNNANAFSNVDIAVAAVSNQAVGNSEMTNIINCLNREYAVF